MWTALFEVSHTGFGLLIPLVRRSRNRDSTHQYEPSSKELAVDSWASLVMFQICRFSFTMLIYELALNFQ